MKLATGFEPVSLRLQGECITIDSYASMLGHQGSNLEPFASKATALPLRHVPIFFVKQEWKGSNLQPCESESPAPPVAPHS